MDLGIVLTLSLLVIFTVFGVAFAYIVFLASEKSSLEEEQDLRGSTTKDLEEALTHRQ